MSDAVSSKNIAVLMTCFNRRDTTLSCLQNLQQQQLLPPDCHLTVYLVDDGCTDGTGEAVREQFAEVRIIEGTGSLFWCGGMRLAWEVAARDEPDAYLWLNDDTQLLPDALSRLIDLWDITEDPDSEFYAPRGSVIIGSCRDPETGATTYGGQHRLGRHPAKYQLMQPQNHPVDCDTFHGNLVLVPHRVFAHVGAMGPFKHAVGDIDYGYRAAAKGCRLLVAPGYYGLCSKNKVICRYNKSLGRRWKILIWRLPPRDYIRFLIRHVGWRFIFYWWRPYLSIFFNSKPWLRS